MDKAIYSYLLAALFIGCTNKPAESTNTNSVIEDSIPKDSMRVIEGTNTEEYKRYGYYRIEYRNHPYTDSMRIESFNITDKKRIECEINKYNDTVTKTWVDYTNYPHR